MATNLQEPLVSKPTNKLATNISAEAQTKKLIIILKLQESQPGETVTACLIHPENKWYRVNWWGSDPKRITRSYVVRVIITDTDFTFEKLV